MSLIGSIINGAASFLGARSSAKGQKDANEKNIDQAQLNRDFQERMSSTAHQREVDDLKKAGLNPILSAKYGGSSTPTGATARVESTRKGHGELAQKGATLIKQLPLLKAQAALVGAQASTAKSNAIIQKQFADLTTSPAGRAATLAGITGKPFSPIVRDVVAGGAAVGQASKDVINAVSPSVKKVYKKVRKKFKNVPTMRQRVNQWQFKPGPKP